MREIQRIMTRDLTDIGWGSGCVSRHWGGGVGVYLCSSYCPLICRTWGQGRGRRRARPLKLSRYEAKLAMIVCAALRQCSVLCLTSQLYEDVEGVELPPSLAEGGVCWKRPADLYEVGVSA